MQIGGAHQLLRGLDPHKPFERAIHHSVWALDGLQFGVNESDTSDGFEVKKRPVKSKGCGSLTASPSGGFAFPCAWSGSPLQWRSDRREYLIFSVMPCIRERRPLSDTIAVLPARDTGAIRSHETSWPAGIRNTTRDNSALAGRPGAKRNRIVVCRPSPVVDCILVLGLMRMGALMLRRCFQIFLIFMMLFIAASPVLAQSTRVALVIGNSEYIHTPRLVNPKNDAADIAAVLQKLGFMVIEGRDLDKAAMDRKIRDFAQALIGAEIGLFFYAGHGLQVGGQNYLVPTDAELKTAAALDFEMVRLDLVHRTMEREARTNLLIIDACRDNPLVRNLARALGTRSTQIGRGFAPVESGEGTLIGFSTQPGNVALDGKGRNSPYAAALLKHLPKPGDDLPSILINVRNDVMEATGRRQVPWEHSALTAKFYFIPPKTPAQQIELEFWASVKDSTSPAVLGTYVDRYPNGEFAPVARALIEHYEQQRKAELAAREEERQRREEERKAAEVRRQEEQRRAREGTIAEERKRAEEAKSVAEMKRLDDEAKAEWLARTEDLRKALEEAKLAREVAKAAEQQRLAAVEAAEKATRAAKEAIAKKGEAKETAADPTKLAALPKIEKSENVEKSAAAGPFDGTWALHRIGPGCKGVADVRMTIYVTNGVIGGQGPVGRIAGTVSPAGQMKFSHATWSGPNKTPDGGTMHYMVSLRGGAGSGTFEKPGSRCNGTLTASRG